ncbi:MAG: MarR family transcriptional regulator [Thaumarchaeota archaeon]|nr:MarR family transcriptional regulator [Nitrososphaerota archaeon]MCL5318367.1 MarR family transcriptional regulator [Nitrososphaerota archaeon]
MQRKVEPDHVLMRTHRALVRSRARGLAKAGLSLPQFEVLRVISAKGPMSMGALSREMVVTPPNITGLIDRLEKQSLVKRAANANDRRASIIELTDAGKNLYDVLAKQQRTFLQNVLNALTSDERETLSTLLSRLRDEILRREGEA